MLLYDEIQRSLVSLKVITYFDFNQFIFLFFAIQNGIYRQHFEELIAGRQIRSQLGKKPQDVLFKSWENALKS